jgi:5-methyltetrahydrofolate--homocysteine methyltransferase
VQIIGQSLQLHREPLAGALAERDIDTLTAHARAQVDAGAGALDLNFGVDGRAIDMQWLAGALRPALLHVPLFLDAGSPAAIAMALDLCEREGVRRPLVANALPAGAGLGTAEVALLRAVSRSRAGLVVSPRLVDREGAPSADPEHVMHEAAEAGIAAREAGVSETIYLDALAYPAMLDPAGCRRSLALLRLYRELPGVERLVAVGNVGFGASQAVGRPLRALYAAAAVGAGATALILPVEEAVTLRAARIAAGDDEPASAVDRWFLALARAVEAGAPPPAAPEGFAAAARLLFDEEDREGLRSS